MRILIVEDEPTLGKQLKSTLEGAGYAVDLSTDGEDGHFMGATEAYDAIILDLGLPDGDGRVEGDIACAALVQGDQVVAPPHVGVADEDLRHGSLAAALLDEQGAGRVIPGDVYLLEQDALGPEQVLGAGAVRAIGGGVDADGLHGGQG